MSPVDEKKKMFHNQHQPLPTNKNPIITNNTPRYPVQLLSSTITNTSTTITTTTNDLVTAKSVIQVAIVKTFHSCATSINRAFTMGGAAPKRDNFSLLLFGLLT
jgi:hypothetical protein